jgi:TolA-binding protein
VRHVILSEAKDLLLSDQKQILRSLRSLRMTSRSLRSFRMTSLVLCLAAITAHAQQPADALFARARQLVANGNGAAGRLIIDSIISATSANLPVYGEALYWRAALAVTSADAERDYRRLAIEYPFSPHAGDATLQLAQLESARGDRASASRNLEQFLADNPKSGERPRAVLLYLRLLFEQNELPRGCSVLRQTLAEIPSSSVELRNQLDYYSPRCQASDAGAGGRVPIGPGATAPTAAPRDTTRTANTNGDNPASARFTLQLAAYKTRAEADALASKLKSRKLDVRVVGSGKLFRVRVGRYATRAAAVAAQRELKARKLDAYVTDIGPDDK